MRKNRLLFFVVFALASFLTCACKKIGDQIVLTEGTSIQTTTSLKEWLKQKKDSTSSLRKKSIDTILSHARWEKAVQRVASNGKILIFVPTQHRLVGLEFIYDPSKKTVDSGNIVRVMNAGILDTSSAIVAIQTYYETVIQKRHTATEYSGAIFTYSISNDFLYDYHFNKGQISAHGILAIVPESQIVKSNSVRVNAMVCELWGHFTEWASGMVTLDYTYTLCSCDEQSTSIDNINGEMKIQSLCAESGNGGTGQSQGPIVRLWNNINNPCLKALLNRVMSSANAMTTTLAQTYAPGSLYAFNYMEVLSPVGDLASLYAMTDPNISGSNGSYWSNISLNSYRMNNSSQELAAAVLMHEAMHSFITANPSLTDGLMQHDYMAYEITGKIKSALMDLFQGINEDHAIALSWVGLNLPGIKGWDLMDEGRKNYIENVLSAFAYLPGSTVGTRPPPGSCN